VEVEVAFGFCGLLMQILNYGMITYLELYGEILHILEFWDMVLLQEYPDV
jgi:hypothetical protein